MTHTVPLVIIQARYHSTRLPGKMLYRLPDTGETLIARAVRLARAAFHEEHVVAAIPPRDVGGPLFEALRATGCSVFAPDIPENDVLLRYWHVAFQRRWHPESVIVRWTPDDPWKEPELCRRVAMGERLPVDRSCEAFTLGMLDEAVTHTPPNSVHREHITHAIFPTTEATPVTMTVDTMADVQRFGLLPPAGVVR